MSAVWGGNERFLDPVWSRPFWEQPLDAWRDYMQAGPYAFWLAAHEAGAVMARQRAGLIVAISEPVIENGFEGQMPPMVETFSRLAHFSLNGLVRGLSVDARPAGIAVIGLLPGFMKTERVEMHLQSLGEDARQQFRYDLAETPEYAGRAVLALANDPNAIARSGQLLYVADLAETYGFTELTAVASAISTGRSGSFPDSTLTARPWFGRRTPAVVAGPRSRLNARLEGPIA